MIKRRHPSNRYERRIFNEEKKRHERPRIKKIEDSPSINIEEEHREPDSPISLFHEESTGLPRSG